MKNIIIILIVSFQLLSAQTFDGASLGMAGNYSAHSRGINAIAWNPANLSMYRASNFELNLVAINAALSSGLSISDYNTYFTDAGHNGRWSKNDRHEIIDLFSGKGLGLEMDLNTNLLGFVSGNFGFGIQFISSGNANIKAGKPLEIFLFGETFERDYSFSEKDVLDASFYSAIKNSIAYSYMIKLDRRKYTFSHLSFGVNLNYYLGLAVAQSQQSSVNMQRIDTGGLESREEMFRYQTDVEARTSDPTNGLAGKGFGLDFGISTRFARAWHVSLSFSNLFAKINWDGNPQTVNYSRIDSTYWFAESGQDTSYTTEVKTQGKSFSTPLPTIMRAGVRLRLLYNLTLTADWHQGLNNSFGNSTVPRIGAGAEYKPFKWLPLRSGMAVGGKDTFLFGIGSGLHFSFMELDFSYAMRKALLPIYSDGFYTAFSLKFLL
ncbi:MAG: hypothetical protein D8M58_07645 [Calditrichaeota bacterium]|nr:MAG: hypothetical protein DWQ03_18845 [Calditrichota bacterium]MBL1205254.1 hypothetical protein [Calditrichota bacterium]NOG45083.1 hypothetical protein [Calditrichota bacterium]